MKKKKFLLIIISIIVIIGIVIAFIVINDREDEDIPNDLVIECSRTASLTNMRTEFLIQVYRGTKALKVINTSKNILNSNMSFIIDSNALNKLVTIYKDQQEQEISDKFGKDYKYVESEIEQKDNYIMTTITYNINENSYMDIVEAFNYDLYNATDDDLANYFREDGFVCEIY